MLCIKWYVIRFLTAYVFQYHISTYTNWIVKGNLASSEMDTISQTQFGVFVFPCSSTSTCAMCKNYVLNPLVFQPSVNLRRSVIIIKRLYYALGMGYVNPISLVCWANLKLAFAVTFINASSRSDAILGYNFARWMICLDRNALHIYLSKDS